MNDPHPNILLMMTERQGVVRLASKDTQSCKHRDSNRSQQPARVFDTPTAQNLSAFPPAEH